MTGLSSPFGALRGRFSALCRRFAPLSGGFTAASDASRLSVAAFALGITHFALCITAHAGDTSETALVFLCPETSSFWRTATNNVVTLPVEFPEGASSATLAVTAPGYSAQYAIASAGDFTLTLPSATSPTTENVYDLALTFDDAASTTRTAKLGVIDSVIPPNSGETRCIAPATDRKWGWVRGRVVIPVPYGITSFTIDGAEAVTGLDGAQGWYPLLLKGGQSAALNLDNDAATATLFRVPEATTISIR